MAIDRAVVIRLAADVRGFSAGMQSAERETSRLEARVASMTSKVQAAAASSAQASSRVAAARRAEAAAAERVTAAESRLSDVRRAADGAATSVGRAEARLAELRSSGAASSSQIAAAEQRVATARRGHAEASALAANAERQLAQAEAAQASAATRVVAGEERAAAATRAHAAAAQQSIARTQAWNVAAGKMAMIGGTLGLGIAAAVKQYADFDQAMSGVRANLQGTPEQMAQVTAAVRQAGAASVFSAVEAANAAEELAKAGLNASQITGGALKGSLDLAAAGGIGLARAAEISATAMAQFHLKGQDVAHIADVMAAAALSSTADVETLAQGMAQGGGMAASLGMSLEQTAGTLALFDQNALKGSDGGTSLKTMLMSLTPNSKAAAAAMEQVGLHAFDAQGNFVGLTTVADQLKNGMKDMGEEQRLAALKTIFGADAARAANVLYEQGAAGLQKYIDQVSKSGVAAQVAAAKQNNLRGDLEKLKGSFQDLMIGSGEGANGPLRGLVQNIDSLISAFSELPSGVQSAIFQVTAFGSAGLLAGAGVIKVVNQIRDLRSGLSTMATNIQSGAAAFRGWATAGNSGMSTMQGLRQRAIQTGTAFQEMGTKAKVGAGLAGAAILAVGLAASTSGTDLENAGRQSSQLALDLQQIGKSGTGMDAIFKDMQIAMDTDRTESFGDALGYVGKNSDEAYNAVSSFTGGLGKMVGVGHGAVNETEAVKDRLKAVGDELGKMVADGKGDQAAQIFSKLATEAQKQGVSTGELMKMMPGYSDAINRATQASKENADAQNKSSLEAVKAGHATDDQKKSVDDLAKAYKDLNNVLLEQRGGARGYQAALDSANDAIKENGRTLDISTEAGRKNQEALDGIASSAGEWASSVLKSTGDQQQANSILEDGRQQYIQMAEAMGMSAPAAEKLANELIKIDGENTVDVKVNGVEAATYGVNALGEQVARLKGSKVEIPAETPNAPQVLQTLTALGLTAKQLSADGTKVSIPTEALKAPETRDAIMGIKGATKDAQGNVTIPTSALNAEATRKALSGIKDIAVTMDGQIVHIPTSAPNAAQVKQILEQVRGAQLTADGKSVTVKSAAPMSADTIAKINSIKGAQVSADKKSVTIPTSAATAPNTKALIDQINSSRKNVDGKSAKVNTSAPNAGKTKGDIDSVDRARRNADGKSATVTVKQVFQTVGKALPGGLGAMVRLGSSIFGGATGGAISDLTQMPRFATGGPLGTINGTPYGWQDGRVGGRVVGPGSATSDQVVTMTSRGLVRTANDEHIIAGNEVAGFGGHAGIYRLRQMAKAGVLPRFASGGSVAGDDWSPDMSGIMAYVQSLKVDPSALTDQRNKVKDQTAALAKATRDLKAAQAGLRGKSGAARVKAENAIATALDKQAKASRELASSRSKLSSMEAGSKADTLGRFMMGESKQNGISKRFLDNIDRIKKRGFPRLARSLLEQGDEDAQNIAQTLSGGRLDQLKQAQSGLDTSDSLADRKSRLLDDLKGVTSAGLTASAQQQANAQLISLRAANNRMAYTGGVVKVEMPTAKQIAAEMVGQVHVQMPQQIVVQPHLDGKVIAQSTTRWQDTQSGLGSTTPGLKL